MATSQQQRKQKHDQQKSGWKERTQDELLHAQRASNEALLTARETLMQLNIQGEQLEHAYQVSNETETTLQKSTRLLRGMTWSGWVENLVTRDVTAPNPNRDYPQSFTNYQLHVHILTSSNGMSKEEQRALTKVCDELYFQAKRELMELKCDQTMWEELQSLHDQQDNVKIYVKSNPPDNINNKNTNDTKSEIFHQRKMIKQLKPDTLISNEQDEQLNEISRNLGELHQMGHNMSMSLSHQDHVVDKLQDKTEELSDMTRMVTRRADRLAQNKSWFSAKRIFQGYVKIKHIKTGLFVFVTSSGKVQLQQNFEVFKLWMKETHGKLCGFEATTNRKWLGQNMLGTYISCTGSQFGKLQEWEFDSKGPSSTPLLCASANWGYGGWIIIPENQNSLGIGSYGVDARKQAAIWCLQHVEQPPSILD